MSAKVTREQIAAYVDGALSEAESARVAEAIAQDGAARAYAAEVEHANRLLREAFGAPMAEAVAPGLRNTILEHPGGRSSEVISLTEARRRRTPILPMALAASVALAIGVGAGAAFLGTWTDRGQQLAVLGPAPADGPLHAALEGLPSGQISPEGVQPMLSFRDGNGRICREFEIMGELPDSLEFGIACRTPADLWQVEIGVTAPMTETGEGGFRPASGPGADALDAMLDSLEAQPAMSPAEEAELLRRGWR